MKKSFKFILRLIKVDQGLEKAWVFLAYIALVNKMTSLSAVCDVSKADLVIWRISELLNVVVDKE